MQRGAVDGTHRVGTTRASRHASAGECVDGESVVAGDDSFEGRWGGRQDLPNEEGLSTGPGEGDEFGFRGRDCDLFLVLIAVRDHGARIGDGKPSGTRGATPPGLPLQRSAGARVVLGVVVVTPWSGPCDGEGI